MRVAVFLTVLLVAAMAIGSAHAQCATISSCSLSGGPCIGGGNNETWCSADLSCVRASPGSSSRICLPPAQIKGRACTVDLDCSSLGLTLGGSQNLRYPKCRNNVCSVDDLVPGDSCSSSSDCRSASCVNGVCSVSTSVGSTCSSDRDCPASNVCVNSRCAAEVDVGGNCQGDSDLCLPTSSCTNNVCVRDNSVAGGGACGSSFNCFNDLVCSSGTCALNTATVGSACTQNSNCGNGACSCNRVTGTQQCTVSTIKCQDQAFSYLQCLQNANCHEDSSPLSEGSCAATRCGSQYNSYLACTSAALDRSLYPSQCAAGLVSPASSLSADLLFFF